ncbi:MAG: phenylalanine--tRNA ligase subunit beta [Bacteroidaceae bacterium]
MNISYNWLKEYVDFDLSAQKVAEALTSIGLEVGGVEEIQTIKGGLKGLVVANVLTCAPHPNSDHMHVCTVDLGNETTQIVCGAPNVEAGQKVIAATLGTTLYDGEESFTIKKSKLRGVESNGMLCAEDEIGVGTAHEGIIVLPQETVVGTPAATYYKIESDFLIEVDITPNRADACSHYGVARDLYAWLLHNGYTTSIHRPNTDLFKVDNTNFQIEVNVNHTEACPRYCAVSITDCHVKDSPAWLQTKLRTIGVRPINNIVDITNYILFAYGQPLHCFDADMIEGKKVIVKTMPEGTPFVTLDGVEHQLSERDLAICNAKEPMCIAGVFGGKGSGTYDTTKNVLFESAYFHPTWIRKSARRHGLNTDASFRFERGIDPNGTLYALKQAAIMACELAGGKVSMEISDHYPNPINDFTIELTYDYVNNLIGKSIDPDTVKSILKSLEIQFTEENEKGLTLQVPAYRVDVQRPCDVVEDILRIYGYNNIEIPTSLKSSLIIKGEQDKNNKLQNIVAEQLVGRGFREILNNSLTRAAYYDHLESYPSSHLARLMNPLSSDLNVMRQTLLFGGLESIAHNANRKNANLKFFEFGNSYTFTAEKRTEGKVLSPYFEEMHLALWITGNSIENSWVHTDEKTSVYELKADVLNVFARLGINMGLLQITDGTNDVFSNSIVIADRNNRCLAQFGVVSKAVSGKMEIENDVYYADLNWTLLAKMAFRTSISYKEISKYPSVSRDLALLIDKNVKFSQIEEVAYATEKKLLKKVELFDVYEGKNLAVDKKSYAVNFVLQDESKTLNDKQIEKIMQNLIQNLQRKLNATLR